MEARVTTRQRRRERILQAAADAIAAAGFHGMSMRELAKASGCSLAGLYNYFAAKDDVLVALHTRAFGALIERAKVALARSDDPVEQLYIFVCMHVGYVTEHPAIMRVLVHEASALPAASRTEIRALKERYFELARSVVARIILQHRDTPPRASEVERITYCIFGMLNWVFGWHQPSRHGGAREVAHTIHQLALSGLVSPSKSFDAVRARVDDEIDLGVFPSPLARDVGDTDANDPNDKDTEAA